MVAHQQIYASRSFLCSSVFAGCEQGDGWLGEQRWLSRAWSLTAALALLVQYMGAGLRLPEFKRDSGGLASLGELSHHTCLQASTFEYRFNT